MTLYVGGGDDGLHDEGRLTLRELWQSETEASSANEKMEQEGVMAFHAAVEKKGRKLVVGEEANDRIQQREENESDKYCDVI